MKRRIIWLLLIPLLALLIVPLCRLKVVKCYRVHYSPLFVEEGGIYFALNTSEEKRSEIQQMWGQARLRNQSFWEETVADPIVIYCSSDELFQEYGNVGMPATTWISVFGNYIVLSQKGANIDVMSHEFCHAELADRVSWLKREQEIPTWFDEGLAMQLDWRGGYEWEDFWELAQEADEMRWTQTLDKPHNFWVADQQQVRMHYMQSKFEVARWLEAGGINRLKAFVQNIRSGQDFQTAYQDRSIIAEDF